MCEIYIRTRENIKLKISLDMLLIKESKLFISIVQFTRKEIQNLKKM